MKKEFLYNLEKKASFSSYKQRLVVRIVRIELAHLFNQVDQFRFGQVGHLNPESARIGHG